MTDQPIEKTVKPDDRITVMVAAPGEPEMTSKTLFMSGGLVRRLTAISQNASDISKLYSDPQLQDIILVEILCVRNQEGKALDAQTLTGLDFLISTEDSDKVIEWAIGHILYFFTDSISKLMNQATIEDSQIQRLTQSLDGLKALAAKRLSAGDSTKTSAE